MKLSEELKIRGAVVGDAFAHAGDDWGGTEAIPSTIRVHNSEFLEKLLSGRYDEAISFLWLVDKNGKKKEKAES